MEKRHRSNCECPSCEGSRFYNSRLERINQKYNGETPNNLGAFSAGVNKSQNYLDEKGSASRYLDSVLVATRPGMTYRDTKGTKYMPFEKGANLGTIYSWVIDSNGSLWWQIDNKGPFANKFVKSEPGLFSGIIAEKTSSGLKIETAKTERQTAQQETDVISNAGKAIVQGAGDVVKGLGKTLSGFGKHFGLIIASVVVIVLVVSFTKLKTA